MKLLPLLEQINGKEINRMKLICKYILQNVFEYDVELYNDEKFIAQVEETNKPVLVRIMIIRPAENGNGFAYEVSVYLPYTNPENISEKLYNFSRLESFTLDYKKTKHHGEEIIKKLGVEEFSLVFSLFEMNKVIHKNHAFVMYDDGTIENNLE